MGENSLLNKERPPVFCPGCAHERVLKTLDRTLVSMGLAGHQIAMVSDIGCSGLFDTFFNTHALHGVHGRVLTYAAGLKLCRPDLTVVATMGDGGLGIGGAHLLAACRRNLDMTLLVLNNFNFGMTGGQCSATSPPDAVLSSGFLNRVERPLDLYRVAAAAGAPFVARCSAYQADLPAVMEAAIRYKGFAIVEIQGICPGRYTKRNKLTPEMIEANVRASGAVNGEIAGNAREEYGSAYRRQCAGLQPVSRPRKIEARFTPPARQRQAAAILGAAGQGIVTAGEVLALACLSGGLHVTQKNDYNITVLRGPSVTDINISPEPIDYTGTSQPKIIVALAAEGVERRRAMLAAAGPEALVLAAAGVALPDTRARVVTVDFKKAGIRRQDWALASLAWLAQQNIVITPGMLEAGLAERFKAPVVSSLKAMMEKVVE
ncbi:MAG TPA: 2-oxoglutarate synthase [Desulfobacteraceae bacterium]|nr:2-oxoacid:acceptor oxidoreductase family protein [Deltaproteobacteria bacterium]RLB95617.1 MAG: 2-oxoglutarate synthase [Deltaproteobacteria bacterium]HDI60450.1 2-oxoglutarate synthase [Desulfobacteraceae bacterium]